MCVLKYEDLAAWLSFTGLGKNSQEFSLRSQVQRSTSSSPHPFSSSQEEILALTYLTPAAASSEVALFHTFPQMLLPPLLHTVDFG